MIPAQTQTRRPQGASVPATTAAARKDVKSLIEGPAFRAEIAKVLPKHLTAERMIRVALTATMKMPKLLLCTADSLTKCLLDCSAIGLEPDGRRAHLIPFEDKKAGIFICTLIIDYKGLVELAMRSGLVSYLYADVVREGDLFEFSLGEIKRHVPWFLRRDEDRPLEAGQDIAVYAYARMVNGASAVAVMSIEEVYSIRDGSQGWQAFKKGYTKKNPWDPSDWVSEQEMKKKTALRRLCKMMPQSPELRDAVEKDDEHDDIKAPIDVTPRQPLFNPPPAPAQVQGAQPDPEPQDGEGQDPRGEVDPQPAPPQDPQPAPQPAPTTELDAKREKIENAFLAAGLNFDNLVAFLASRGQDVAETSFAELPEPVVNRLTRALDSFVKQAKALKEGGAS